MGAQHFAITADPARRLVTIGFASVFWDMTIAERFRTECRAAVASLGCRPGEHLVLVDLRTAVLQSQEVIVKMQALIGASTAARIALIASSPLARMQTKRLQIRENVVMFADAAQAREWLFEKPGSARVAAA